MATDKDKRLDELGYTRFEASRGQNRPVTGGRLRKFLSAFFTKKGQQALADEDINDGEIAGDTVRTLDVTKEQTPKGEEDPR